MLTYAFSQLKVLVFREVISSYTSHSTVECLKTGEFSKFSGRETLRTAEKLTFFEISCCKKVVKIETALHY